MEQKKCKFLWLKKEVVLQKNHHCPSELTMLALDIAIGSARSLGALVWLVIHVGWKSEADPQTVFQISLLWQMDGKPELG